MTISAGRVLLTQPLVLRVVSDLALAAAVDHSLAAAAQLELHLAGRLVQAVELAGRVGASDELPGQLHVHPIVHSKGKLRHSPALIEAVLDEEVDKRTFAGWSGVGVHKTSVYPIPRVEKQFISFVAFRAYQKPKIVYS